MESALSVLVNNQRRVLDAEKREPRGAETPVPSPGERCGVSKVERGFLHPCHQPALRPGFGGDYGWALTASQSLAKGTPPLPPSMWLPFKIDVLKPLETLCHPYPPPQNILYVYRILHHSHNPFPINYGFELHEKSLR